MTTRPNSIYEFFQNLFLNHQLYKNVKKFVLDLIKMISYVKAYLSNIEQRQNGPFGGKNYILWLNFFSQ